MVVMMNYFLYFFPPLHPTHPVNGGIVAANKMAAYLIVDAINGGASRQGVNDGKA
jgi:hypothetical protein